MTVNLKNHEIKPAQKHHRKKSNEITEERKFGFLFTLVFVDLYKSLSAETSRHLTTEIVTKCFFLLMHLA